MSRPSTNCLPMIFMAAYMAERTTGSPSLLTMRPSRFAGLPSSFLSSLMILPVSISPQVEAFTRVESLLRKWDDQLAPESLSLIRASAVSASGMRSSASARHIRMIPS